MSNISFELPQHPMGEKREALLGVSDHICQLINLDELQLDFLPDIIIVDNCRYKYSGVEHGRGIYRIEEEVLNVISNGISQIYETTLHDNVVASRRNYGLVVCSKCQKLSEILSSMFDNPPGFDGIKVGKDHYGNKYIDLGWQEAIRRVQAAMGLATK